MTTVRADVAARPMNAGRELDALVAEKVMGDVPGLVLWPAPYSTHIGCAWRVVEQLRKSGDVISLNWYPGAGQWECVVHRLPHAHGEDATAPHAICLAALQAVGVKG